MLKKVGKLQLEGATASTDRIDVVWESAEPLPVLIRYFVARIVSPMLLLLLSACMVAFVQSAHPYRESTSSNSP